MNAVTENADLKQRGLYHKFDVIRIDGEHVAGGKHHGDAYFPLNLTRMSAATRSALKAYVAKIEHENTALAADLRAVLRASLPSEFVTVPDTTLPEITLEDGTVIPSMFVPAFEIARCMSTVVDGKATIQIDGTPTVYISYFDANQAAENAGLKVLSESRAWSLAYNLLKVGANWTSGQVGVGKPRQGLRKGNVDEVQANDYVPEDPDEDRKFYLPNGDYIIDGAGGLYTHIFNDSDTGDERGLIAKPFAATSRSIAMAPQDSYDKGFGWVPKLPCNWSGDALVRGGYWYSVDHAGVFYLDGYHPGSEYGDIGFRCTKP